MPIKIDIQSAESQLKNQPVKSFQKALDEAHNKLIKASGPGSDFLGWMHLPSQTNHEQLLDMQNKSRSWIAGKEVLVLIGIGGSYLGTRAVYEALSPYFPKTGEKEKPEIIYAGHQLSNDYLSELLTYLSSKDFSLMVISKSGTTTEPAIAFRLLKKKLEENFGRDEAARRIIAITDKEKGALKQLAEKEHYLSFVVPDDVGGRFSVLSPVGLVPLAAMNVDIMDLMAGAKAMEHICDKQMIIGENPVASYAAIRNALYQEGKTTEILVNFEEKLSFFNEWWKQLFGESEGKDHKGIFPASVHFTTDLHSLGQYIQDGRRDLFETMIHIEQSRHKLLVPYLDENADGLNYLAGKSLHEINQMAGMGTQLAHVDGGVPNLNISLPRLDAYHLGALIYFFEMSCALSGYLLEVNPFDQPGVEAYKNNMFALLGKPGFEQTGAALKKRLENG